MMGNEIEGGGSGHEKIWSSLEDIVDKDSSSSGKTKETDLSNLQRSFKYLNRTERNTLNLFLLLEGNGDIYKNDQLSALEDKIVEKLNKTDSLPEVKGWRKIVSKVTKTIGNLLGIRISSIDLAKQAQHALVQKVPTQEVAQYRLSLIKKSWEDERTFALVTGSNKELIKAASRALNKADFLEKDCRDQELGEEMSPLISQLRSEVRESLSKKNLSKLEARISDSKSEINAPEKYADISNVRKPEDPSPDQIEKLNEMSKSLNKLNQIKQKIETEEGVNREKLKIEINQALQGLQEATQAAFADSCPFQNPQKLQEELSFLDSICAGLVNHFNKTVPLRGGKFRKFLPIKTHSSTASHIQSSRDLVRGIIEESAFPWLVQNMQSMPNELKSKREDVLKAKKDLQKKLNEAMSSIKENPSPEIFHSQMNELKQALELLQNRGGVLKRELRFYGYTSTFISVKDAKINPQLILEELKQCNALLDTNSDFEEQQVLPYLQKMMERFMDLRAGEFKQLDKSDKGVRQEYKHTLINRHSNEIGLLSSALTDLKRANEESIKKTQYDIDGIQKEKTKISPFKRKTLSSEKNDVNAWQLMAYQKVKKNLMECNKILDPNNLGNVESVKQSKLKITLLEKIKEILSLDREEWSEHVRFSDKDTTGVIEIKTGDDWVTVSVDPDDHHITFGSRLLNPIMLYLKKEEIKDKDISDAKGFIDGGLITERNSIQKQMLLLDGLIAPNDELNSYNLPLEIENTLREASEELLRTENAFKKSGARFEDYEKAEDVFVLNHLENLENLSAELKTRMPPANTLPTARAMSIFRKMRLDRKAIDVKWESLKDFAFLGAEVEKLQKRKKTIDALLGDKSEGAENLEPKDTKIIRFKDLKSDFNNGALEANALIEELNQLEISLPSEELSFVTLNRVLDNVIRECTRELDSEYKDIERSLGKLEQLPALDNLEERTKTVEIWSKLLEESDQLINQLTENLKGAGKLPWIDGQFEEQGNWVFNKEIYLNFNEKRAFPPFEKLSAKSTSEWESIDQSFQDFVYALEKTIKEFTPETKEDSKKTKRDIEEKPESLEARAEELKGFWKVGEKEIDNAINILEEQLNRLKIDYKSDLNKNKTKEERFQNIEKQLVKLKSKTIDSNTLKKRRSYGDVQFLERQIMEFSKQLNSENSGLYSLENFKKIANIRTLQKENGVGDRDMRVLLDQVNNKLKEIESARSELPLNKKDRWVLRGMKLTLENKKLQILDKIKKDEREGEDFFNKISLLMRQASSIEQKYQVSSYIHPQGASLAHNLYLLRQWCESSSS